MCVIMIAETKRPSELMLRAGMDQNDQGNGIAWREDKQVKWAKGLSDDELVDLAFAVPLPFICHFRIATVGGKLKELCHPFPIDNSPSVALTGATKGSMLFHNGHWSEWRRTICDATLQAKLKIPPGEWSDSRAMAYAVSIYGHNFANLLDDERVVIFGPSGDDLEVFGSGWEEGEDGVFCSNLGFKHRMKFMTIRDKVKNPAEKEEISRLREAACQYHQTLPHSMGGPRTGPNIVAERPGPKCLSETEVKALLAGTLTDPAVSGGTADDTPFRTVPGKLEASDGNLEAFPGSADIKAEAQKVNGRRVEGARTRSQRVAKDLQRDKERAQGDIALGGTLNNPNLPPEKVTIIKIDDDLDIRRKRDMNWVRSLNPMPDEDTREALIRARIDAVRHYGRR